MNINSHHFLGMTSIVLPLGIEINSYGTFLQSDWRVDIIIQSVSEPKIPDVPINRFAVYISIASHADVDECTEGLDDCPGDNAVCWNTPIFLSN